MKLARFFPCLEWGRTYSRDTLVSDGVAAIIVTIMLIPQSLAYAMLAGLPPEMGLYASVLPLIVYALFGTSRALAVGPAAVTSLLTASAAGALAVQGTPGYALVAVALAFISGLVLMGAGVLRLGFLANFLSHPVISGFVTASGILIAASQMKHILGIKTEGETLIELGHGFVETIDQANIPTMIIGFGTIVFLFWVRKQLKPLLISFGLKPRSADLLAKAGPVGAIIVTTASVMLLALDGDGVKIVGDIPNALPPFALPPMDLGLWRDVAGSAVLIAVVGFVESISVAQTFAAKRRQRVSPNQEMIGLGAANLASSVSHGLPVTGGFSRSVVNFDAGAETPMAGAFTAVGIGIAILALTPFLHDLPKATLAATIIVAVLQLVDFKTLRHTWVYSKADFACASGTIAVTLLEGVEAGITIGILLSIGIYLWKASRPHVAIVGQVPGTEHFRNVKRHQVVTSPNVISIRIDESLFFANARHLEETMLNLVVDNPNAKHIVLLCAAVNSIDASALESLEAINLRLKDSGVTLHFSEIKGPVMDRLKRSHLLEHLTGEVFLSHYQAICRLDPEAARQGGMVDPTKAVV